MPGYKIKIGYGLHLGWGIEGAIGKKKIHFLFILCLNFYLSI